MIIQIIRTTNQILAKSKEVIHIKILTDAMDGSKWIEISKEEYELNYTDKINFMYSFEQDTGKIGYYRKEVLDKLEVLKFCNNESSKIKNERMED